MEISTDYDAGDGLLHPDQNNVLPVRPPARARLHAHAACLLCTGRGPGCCCHPHEAPC